MNRKYPFRNGPTHKNTWACGSVSLSTGNEANVDSLVCVHSSRVNRCVCHVTGHTSISFNVCARWSDAEVRAAGNSWFPLCAVMAYLWLWLPPSQTHRHPIYVILQSSPNFPREFSHFIPIPPTHTVSLFLSFTSISASLVSCCFLKGCLLQFSSLFTFWGRSFRRPPVTLYCSSPS